jgi:hypothetical protein
MNAKEIQTLITRYNALVEDSKEHQKVAQSDGNSFSDLYWAGAINTYEIVIKDLQTELRIAERRAK